jgi:hypothetical protein
VIPLPKTKHQLPRHACQVKEVAIRKHGSLSVIEAIKDEKADRKFTSQAEQRKRGAEGDAEAEREEALVREESS